MNKLKGAAIAVLYFISISAFGSEPFSQVGENVFFTTKAGHLKKIQQDTSREWKADEQNQLAWESASFEHAGKKFYLFSLTYVEDPRRRESGESYVIREDGKMLRVDFGSRSFETSAGGVKGYTIKNGILYIRSCMRPVDLDRFDFEAKYQSRTYHNVQKTNEQRTIAKPPFEILEEAGFRNLTQEALTENEPDIEIDQRIMDSVVESLLSSEIGSGMIVGKAGVGKSVALREIPKRIARGKSPIPRTWLVYELRSSTLNAGMGMAGALETRLDAMIEAGRIRPVIYLADQAHSLIGTGTSSHDPNDFFQKIKTDLGTGKIRIIGNTTTTDWKAKFAGDTDLANKFSLINMESPSGEKLLAILKGWITTRLLDLPNDAFLQELVHISTNFSSMGSVLQNSTKLLDKVYSYIQRAGHFDRAPTIEELHAVAQRTYNVNEAYFNPEKMRARIQSLLTELNELIVGHDEAKQALVDLTMQAFAGTVDPTKPEIRVFFDGPAGVGKTELAKAYAEIMGLPFKRFEMGNLTSVENFVQDLAQTLIDCSHTVILFDEFEKAPNEIQNVVLGMLDSGKFSANLNSDSSSRNFQSVEINALRSRIFVTGNATAHMNAPTETFGFAPKAEVQVERKRKVNEFRERLKEAGISEFVLDRMQQVFHFGALTREQFKEVLRIQLKRFKKEQKKAGRETKLHNIETFVEEITQQYYTTGNGNRDTLRAMEQTLRSDMAKLILENPILSTGTVGLTYKNGRFEKADCELTAAL